MTSKHFQKGANIVRQSNRQIRTNEPSGESESLRGRQLDKMGSKAERMKAPNVKKREEVTKKGYEEKIKKKGISMMGKKRIVRMISFLNFFQGSCVSMGLWLEDML